MTVKLPVVLLTLMVYINMISYFYLRLTFSRPTHFIKSQDICDVACQNQAFVAEMSYSVMMFLGKNVTLAFI